MEQLKITNSILKKPAALLEFELKRRCQKNENYSLRAFAKSLGISHTVLSLVLSKQRPLSKKAALKVGEAFLLAPHQLDLLLASSGTQKLKTPRMAERMRNSEEGVLFSLDRFELIADWIHYGILSALEIPSAKFEAKWISRILNISEIKAKFSMQRLERLNLVAKDTNGKWRQTEKNIRVENSISTRATRKFQSELLLKARSSLLEDHSSIRDHSSMTMAINENNIEYARDRIREFRRELSAELEDMGNANRVYNLTVQIYPISKKVEE
ncbi:MAG: TIGR02147 family protein [Proteobacteria bacterium]|nr:TIGR02147 family protein [Pseudomonadota bacterium]